MTRPRDEGPLNDTDVSVTVVIPMFNAVSTIERTIRSVLDQTVQPTRIIVVDDASTDGSTNLVSAMNVRGLELVPLDRNGGASVARNEGARRAATEWIGFLDADDFWEPTFIEEITAGVRSTGARFASTGGVRVLRNKGVQHRLIPGPASATDQTRNFWRIAIKFVPAHPSFTIVRRDLFEQVGGFPEHLRAGEDWVLWSRLWLEGRFAFINKPLASWVLTSHGASAHLQPITNEWAVDFALARTLLVALRRRREGSIWFAVWLIRTAARRQIAYAITGAGNVMSRIGNGMKRARLR